jgi:hypothetical protein
VLVIAITPSATRRKDAAKMASLLRSWPVDILRGTAAGRDDRRESAEKVEQRAKRPTKKTAGKRHHDTYLLGEITNRIFTC